MAIYLHKFHRQGKLKILSFNLYQSDQSPEKGICIILMLTLSFNFLLEDTEFCSKGVLKFQLREDANHLSLSL